MRYLILGLLLGGPLSLYDVHKCFTGGISLFYAASFGSIQRALANAEEQGWVTVMDEIGSRRRKRLYEVTERGRDEWRRWMKSAPTGSDTEQAMLARIYLLGWLAPEDRAECLTAIRSRLMEDAEALASLATRLDDGEKPSEVREIYRYQRATLDYGIRSHSLVLAWLDELENSQ